MKSWRFWKWKDNMSLNRNLIFFNLKNTKIISLAVFKKLAKKFKKKIIIITPENIKK